MNPEIREYLSEIGRRGGRVSRRELSREDARRMVRVREAGRAYRNFHARCFWSYSPDLKIRDADVEWVAERLKKHGGREAWQVAVRLCR
jgi:hypothetical protein